ncbi:hypothetical protein KSP39_PZI015606 [Platanthera zijinensis]|uniref:CASP-like protein n=1 Tax=Platanthera zijinensis TaxID=2320716 RepID=A0AAP0B883_9ASPA
MSESPHSPPFHEAEGLPPALPSASPNPSPLHHHVDRPLAPPVSSQASLQKTNSGERDGVLTKNIGFPLRLLLRELEPERKLDSTKRESSLPASPLRSPENTIRSENSVKSSERDGPIIDARLNSLLEHAGSPIGFTAGSLPAENHVDAMAAEAIGSRRGKVLRMESGVVRRAALRKVEVGLRVSEVVLCIVSFSVMAANKTSGWAGDFFERYQEYRYCFSVNVIASAYSTFQLYSQFHYRIWKSHIISHPLSYSFEFVMDQENYTAD